jgi:hypothetical protein
MKQAPKEKRRQKEEEEEEEEEGHNMMSGSFLLFFFFLFPLPSSTKHRHSCCCCKHRLSSLCLIWIFKLSKRDDSQNEDDNQKKKEALISHNFSRLSQSVIRLATHTRLPRRKTPVSAQAENAKKEHAACTLHGYRGAVPVDQWDGCAFVLGSRCRNGNLKERRFI